MIWDLAYNARVEAMRALLTSDNVDLTKKNEVGHDALYMALGNVFFNISEQCEYAIRTYGAATISTLLVNDFDDKIKGFEPRRAPVRRYQPQHLSAGAAGRAVLRAGRPGPLPHRDGL